MKTKRRFPVLENAEDDIITICLKKVEELYGVSCPAEITDRLTNELESITHYNNEVIYMVCALLADKARQGGHPTMARGSVGSSLAAYLLGITEVNPLRPHYHCKICKRIEFVPDVASGFDLPDKSCLQCGNDMNGDGHNLLVETFMGLDGDRGPYIDFNFTTDMAAKGKELFGEIFPNDLIIRGGYTYEGNKLFQHPMGLMVIPCKYIKDIPIEYIGVNKDLDLTVQDFRNLYDIYLSLDIVPYSTLDTLYQLSSETGVSPENIPMNDRQTLEAFTSADVSNIPGFKFDFVRRILTTVKPKTFSDLVRISAISHSNYVWMKQDSDTGEIFDISEMPAYSEIIACRDDIMIYLQDKGVDKSTAYEIMEHVRKGKGLPQIKEEMLDYQKAMTESGIPDWYIDSCNQTKYLFPKAHAISCVMTAFRLAWFKTHYPIEFNKVVVI